MYHLIVLAGILLIQIYGQLDVGLYTQLYVNEKTMIQHLKRIGMKYEIRCWPEVNAQLFFVL